MLCRTWPPIQGTLFEDCWLIAALSVLEHDYVSSLVRMNDPHPGSALVTLFHRGLWREIEISDEDMESVVLCGTQPLLAAIIESAVARVIGDANMNHHVDPGLGLLLLTGFPYQFLPSGSFLEGDSRRFSRPVLVYDGQRRHMLALVRGNLYDPHGEFVPWPLRVPYILRLLRDFKRTEECIWVPLTVPQGPCQVICLGTFLSSDPLSIVIQCSVVDLVIVTSDGFLYGPLRNCVQSINANVRFSLYSSNLRFKSGFSSEIAFISRSQRSVRRVSGQPISLIPFVQKSVSALSSYQRFSLTSSEEGISWVFVCLPVNIRAIVSASAPVYRSVHSVDGPCPIVLVASLGVDGTMGSFDTGLANVSCSITTELLRDHRTHVAQSHSMELVDMRIDSFPQPCVSDTVSNVAVCGANHSVFDILISSAAGKALCFTDVDETVRLSSTAPFFAVFFSASDAPRRLLFSVSFTFGASRFPKVYVFSGASCTLNLSLTPSVYTELSLFVLEDLVHRLFDSCSAEWRTRVVSGGHLVSFSSQSQHWQFYIDDFGSGDSPSFNIPSGATVLLRRDRSLAYELDTSFSCCRLV